MDPLQALAEMDAALSTLKADRKTHAHLIRCATVLRSALSQQEATSGDNA